MFFREWLRCDGGGVAILLGCQIGGYTVVLAGFELGTNSNDTVRCRVLFWLQSVLDSHEMDST